MTLNRAAASAELDHFEQQYRRRYTAESHRYEQIRFSHQAGQAFNQTEQQAIWDLLRIRPGQRLLDVAAGTGRIAAALAERGLDVVAYDLTQNMLRQTQLKADRLASGSLRCVGGNGRTLPFPSGQFDAVISIRFLHLFPVARYRAFVQEMWRVVRPGGVLLVQFDSALAGAGAGWLRELYHWATGHNPPYLLWPHQIPAVFEGIGPTTLHGFSPFGGRFIQRLAPEGASRLERWLSDGPRSFLANRVFVRAVKPGA